MNAYFIKDDISVLTEPTILDNEKSKKVDNYDNFRETFETNIKDMNLIKIKEKCKLNNIKGYSTMNKDKLIEELLKKYDIMLSELKSLKVDELKLVCGYSNIKCSTTKGKLIESILTVDSLCIHNLFISSREYIISSIDSSENISEKKEKESKIKKNTEKEQEEDKKEKIIKSENNKYQDEQKEDTIITDKNLRTANSEDLKKIPKTPCYNCGGLHFYKKTPCIFKISKEEIEKEQFEKEQREKEQREKEQREKEKQEKEQQEKERIEKEQQEKDKGTKKTIPKSVKKDVWNLYIGGDIIKHKCLCCKKVTIENTNFHCGHVISEKNGGTLEICNLRPICSSCNHSMGCENMVDYVKTYGYYIG